MSRIQELRELLAGAWPAPWVASTFEVDCPCPNGTHCGDSHTCDEVAAPDAYPDGQCVVQISVPGLESLSGPNAQFIAASRNAMSALLDVAEAAEPFADHACDCDHLPSDTKCFPCRLRDALARLDGGK